MSASAIKIQVFEEGEDGIINVPKNESVIDDSKPKKRKIAEKKPAKKLIGTRRRQPVSSSVKKGKQSAVRDFSVQESPQEPNTEPMIGLPKMIELSDHDAKIIETENEISKTDTTHPTEASQTAKKNNPEIADGDAKKDKVKNLIAQFENDRLQESEEIEPEKEKLAPGRSVNIYKKIAYFFLLLVVVLSLLIAFYTLPRAHITLIPNQERMSNNMIFDIRDQSRQVAESGNVISGIVKKVEIKSEKKINSSGTEVIGKEVSGKAVIYNNYNKNQPLVASTRLLSADNKLFRIRNTVNVPAGGSVEVEIYADTAGPESAVGPTKFSIPGLWAGLQDKIYGESKESIDYRQKVKKYILQSDIDDGERELKQQLLSDAKAQINNEYKDFSEIIYKINEDTVASKIDKKVGDEVEDFGMTMSAEVLVVAFNEDKTAVLAKQKFISALSENEEMVSFDEKNIVYALNSYDEKQGSANVSASFEGKTSVKNDFDIIEVDKILGLNNKQAEAYLKDIKKIAGYEIKYSPSFIKKMPSLVDRIKIEIKK